jgi:hypothetical protein
MDFESYPDLNAPSSSSNIINSNSSTSDIRSSNFINENDKIIEWCNKLETIERTAPAIFKFYTELCNDKTGPSNNHPKAIFTKFKFTDRGFFRYFSPLEPIKPQHQNMKLLKNNFTQTTSKPTILIISIAQQKQKSKILSTKPSLLPSLEQVIIKVSNTDKLPTL